MTQDLALEILLAGHSAFLTGAAGAGKTYTLNKFIDLARQTGKKVAVTATTGLAATHLNGNTIHSWSGLGIRDELDDYFFAKFGKTHAKNIRETDVLVIDEISMLHDFRLDLVDEILRTIRGVDPDSREQNSNFAKPFGSMQVIFSGDFFQLPPVTRRGENRKDPSTTAGMTGYRRNGNDWDGVDSEYNENGQEVRASSARNYNDATRSSDWILNQVKDDKPQPDHAPRR